MVEHVPTVVDPLPRARKGDVSRRTETLGLAVEWASRHSVLFPVAAFFLVGVAGNLPSELFQDGWLALLGGREIVAHGLPSHDTLTIWTQGREWVDQQWLAQLFFYGLYAFGGLKLALAAHVVAVAGAFTIAIAFARRRGASTRSICWVSVPAYFLLTWSAWNARAQSLALLLFVLLVLLLIADARSPSRRVFLALPLLALWANVHGTAAMAATLVALRGITYAAERRSEPRARWLPRTAALVIAPFACLFASPYATSLPHYYEAILLNGGFRQLVVEWRPTAPSLQTAPFYLLAFLAVWLIGRAKNRLSTYEKALLVFTLVLGLTAMRSVIWFTLAALMLLPTLLDVVLRENTAAMRFRLLNRAFVAASVIAAALTLAVVAAKPSSWFQPGYPNDVLAAVDRAQAREPNMRVFADEMYGDWLLLRRPELRGRLAFDIRFELITKAQLQNLLDIKRRVEGWQRKVAPYSLFVLTKGPDSKLAKSLLRLPGARLEYRGHGAIVIWRKSRT
jgi:hypothetical protein